MLLQTAQGAIDLPTAFVGTCEGALDIFCQSPPTFRDGLGLFRLSLKVYLSEVVLCVKGATSISVILALRSASLSCNSSRRIVRVYASA